MTQQPHGFSVLMHKRQSPYDNSVGRTRMVLSKYWCGNGVVTDIDKAVLLCCAGHVVPKYTLCSTTSTSLAFLICKLLRVVILTSRLNQSFHNIVRSIILLVLSPGLTILGNSGCRWPGARRRSCKARMWRHYRTNADTSGAQRRSVWRGNSPTTYGGP